MEPQVNLSVSFKGETQSFLVSDSSNTTWADVEAMVKVSFDLNNIQIKYMDEDNDEVSVNSEEEYEEALKIAAKLGNQLQMNVYEENLPPKETLNSCSVQVCENMGSERMAVLKDGKKPLSHYSLLARAIGENMKKTTTQETLNSCSTQVCEKAGSERMTILKDGKKSLSHYSLLAQTIGEDMKTTTQQKLNQGEAGRTSKKPPEWFTSYLETFREQIVKETVEKLEQKLSEKLVLHNQPLHSSSSSLATAHSTLETHSAEGHQCDWLISCSHCQTRIVGIRYQCSLCPAYNICELCEAGTYSHDPNHVLLKLRKPILCTPEHYSLGQFSPRLPATLEQVRLQKQMDKRFLKAEKQRLRAEKKQRKAEVRELKKQLKLHRKIHLWNSVHALETPSSPAVKPESLKPNGLMTPVQPCPMVVSTLSAAFIDENLPDGTHLQPGTRFIKHWQMKNTGSVEWSLDTKLKFMWGNLTLASSEKKDMLVPSLAAGQVGTVSVEFIAPALEGTYTSHWRLSHKGEQFGPRIWCSIVVDSFPATACLESNQKTFSTSQKDKVSCKKEVAYSSEADAQQAVEVMELADLPVPAIPLKIKNPHSEREFYIPSVDLLTAQDLLSFELLDINIVQELERVPHNTPVDMTPCMSPLPHDGPLIEKPGLGQIEEENEGSGFKPLLDAHMKLKAEHPVNQEEGEEDMSGTQFVCETVIRSLTLDAAPDHQPLQRKKSLQNSLQMLQEAFSYSVKNEEPVRKKSSPTSKPQQTKSYQTEAIEGNEFEKCAISEGSDISEETNDCEDEEEDVKDEVQSQGSSASEDYIIILPECFDTSRPLGESMYSSALSQPSMEKAVETDMEVLVPEGEGQLQVQNINDILTTSQTLDTVPLTPEVVGTVPQQQRDLSSLQIHNIQEPSLSAAEEIISTAVDQIREEPRTEDFLETEPSENINNKSKFPEYSRHPQGNSIAGGLVKGALSVAASAYKALFAGPPIVEQQPTATEEQTATLLANLCEMGFCDRQLNLRLLKKHNYNMVQVVTELLQINNSDWYGSRY
ncbi:PREDICTED: next to BRCA1 gene 1 protein isoform X1 [Gavialis gangeticus]|uniref:next to BRCA1 gene 1 protein isoform X1 n=1 Tax=Gavialis gangeticus TaxID=94835 RepID=UPI00092EB743|nr:PREDICTED: next to BRCA1 gene 1 protein isoform X1 [Gavialis gangeticus]XP_019360962.1 PREDICTED: next to BRCA1 gene 1 protein isoform X1 [Gavialis gangeticus]